VEQVTPFDEILR